MGFEFIKKLPTPDEIRNQYPIDAKIKALKEKRDQEIRDVFTGKSDKFLAIIGPCSADNEDAVCGIQYNGDPYYFFKNLRGDVIAIVNKDAETVAKYSYDAWGVCTISQDNSDCEIV